MLTGTRLTVPRRARFLFLTPFLQHNMWCPLRQTAPCWRACVGSRKPKRSESTLPRHTLRPTRKVMSDCISATFGSCRWGSW